MGYIWGIYCDIYGMFMGYIWGYIWDIYGGGSRGLRKVPFFIHKVSGFINV